MPRGASPKREREYEELKQRFQKSGRYGGRATEVAARIVNKQRREYGETRGEKRQERAGRSPDRDLPIAHYRELTIAEIERRLPRLTPAERRTISNYERQHKNRKGVLAALGGRRAA